MKKIYAILSSTLLIGSLQAQVVWDNFENSRKGDYGFISGTFIPYNENPDQSGANTSLVAARYTRNAADLFDVILIEAVMADLGPYISGSSQMQLDVWSPAAGKTVQITLENNTLAQPANYPTGRHSEYTAVTTVAQGWETLTFNLVGQPDPTVGNTNANQMVLLFDPNSNNNDTYYWDNLRGPELANDPCEGVTPDPAMLNDFECQQNVNYIFSHSGINFRRELNPDQSGNPSSHVARYVRNGGEEFDVLIGRFSGNLDLEPTSRINLDVWDPAAPTNIIVSLQNNNGDVIIEMTAATSASSTWQTLVYDPSSVFEATDISQFVILFDPGSGTSDTYYFDNFELDSPSSVDQISSVNTFTAYPNPSPGQTRFDFDLAKPSAVRYVIYDITGKVIEEVNLGQLPAGNNSIEWNNTSLAEGMYLYTFEIDGQRATGKIIIK
jgi:hypothetical protein